MILVDLMLFFLLFARGDIAGALDQVLTDAPYGSSVEEAKVRMAAHSYNCSLTRHFITEPESANTRDDLEQYQVNRDSWSDQVVVSRCTGHPHEVLVQRHGPPWVGGCQW